MANLQPSVTVASDVIFRSRPIFRSGARLAVTISLIVLMVSIAVMSGDAWIWPVGCIALLALAAAWVGPRYRLVIELAQIEETLFARTLFQRRGAPAIRIPKTEITDWREYVELRRGFGLTSIANRIIAFRHQGVSYGMATDHAELLDRSSLDLLSTRA
jgi:hypothetical protein